MSRKSITMFTILVMLVALNGCSTLCGKKTDLKTQELNNQISVLEAQVQSKDQEIEDLKESLGQLEAAKSQATETATKKYIGEVKKRPNIKQIQIALANAGYNPGRIDGQMGKQTRNAIKEFQKDNNLGVDGKVGAETWSLLKKHLYKKIK